MTSLMSEGLALMLVGMGFVFIFLTSLVIVTHLMSRLIRQYEKNVGAIPESGVPSPTAVVSHAMTANKTLLSVLSAAVHKYRSHR